MSKSFELTCLVWPVPQATTLRGRKGDARLPIFELVLTRVLQYGICIIALTIFLTSDSLSLLIHIRGVFCVAFFLHAVRCGAHVCFRRIFCKCTCSIALHTLSFRAIVGRSVLLLPQW